MQPKLPPRLKLLRSNPLRLSLIRYTGSDPRDILFDDQDLQVCYRRPEVYNPPNVPNLDDDQDISEHAQLRLFLARQLALMRYREIHGTA